MRRIQRVQQKNRQLQHLLLQISRKSEVLVNSGIPIFPEEESLFESFESMQRELSNQSQYKSCLNQLVHQVEKLSGNFKSSHINVVDPASFEALQQASPPLI